MADVRHIPEGYPRVTPYLVVDGAGAAIDFYSKVLGATQRMRMDGPGRHAWATPSSRSATSLIMLADEMPQMGITRSPEGRRRHPDHAAACTSRTSTPCSRRALAGRRDRHARAVERPASTATARASSRTRGATAGSVSTHVEDVPPEEMERRAAEMMAEHFPEDEALSRGHQARRREVLPRRWRRHHARARAAADDARALAQGGAPGHRRIDPREGRRRRLLSEAHSKGSSGLRAGTPRGSSSHRVVTRMRSVPRRWPSSAGRPRWARSRSPRGRFAATTSTIRMSCASTWTRSRARTSPTPCASPLRHACSWTSLATRVSRRPRAGEGSTCTSGSSAAGRSRTFAMPRLHSGASSNGVYPVRSRPSGGRRSAARASSSTTTRTLAIARLRRPTASGRSRVRRSPRRSRGTSSPTSRPRTLTVATMPARFAEVGDRHAAIDEAARSLQPLLDMYESDEAEGEGDMPYPPDYPKMPGEPKRVCSPPATATAARSDRSRCPARARSARTPTTTRTPPQVADTARASGRGKPGAPATSADATSSSPTRDRIATPFQCRLAVQPRLRSRGRGSSSPSRSLNASSASLRLLQADHVRLPLDPAKAAAAARAA